MDHCRVVCLCTEVNAEAQLLLNNYQKNGCMLHTLDIKQQHGHYACCRLHICSLDGDRDPLHQHEKQHGANEMNKVHRNTDKGFNPRQLLGGLLLNLGTSQKKKYIYILKSF